MNTSPPLPRGTFRSRPSRRGFWSGGPGGGWEPVGTPAFPRPWLGVHMEPTVTHAAWSGALSAIGISQSMDLPRPPRPDHLPSFSISLSLFRPQRKRGCPCTLWWGGAGNSVSVCRGARGSLQPPGWVVAEQRLPLWRACDPLDAKPQGPK